MLVSYKVYMISDINVWVMVNGCVCVYFGLMDLMIDNESEGVLGYELGYVFLGYFCKVMQIVYVMLVVCDVIFVISGVVVQFFQF